MSSFQPIWTSFRPCKLPFNAPQKAVTIVQCIWLEQSIEKIYIFLMHFYNFFPNNPVNTERYCNVSRKLHKKRFRNVSFLRFCNITFMLRIVKIFLKSHISYFPNQKQSFWCWNEKRNLWLHFGSNIWLKAKYAVIMVGRPTLPGYIVLVQLYIS